MCIAISKFDRPRPSHARRKERGVALILVLLTLMLLSAIGLGMMYMSNTETAVNSNYRDTQLAFFAMRAGLEEARDRMRTSSAFPLVNPPTSNLPATMPGSLNSILYITNPSNGEVVNPVLFGNQYFDDEFCHENFVGSGVAFVPPTGPPCGAGPPLASVASVTSIDPNTGTAASMKYKWVRITLKQNGTFANGVAANRVDPTQGDGQQICYETTARQQIPVNLVPGGPFPDCATAQAAGADASPVYIVTALAVTPQPQASRRIGQYEVAAFSLFPPAGALGLDGPGVIFSQDLSSNNFNINGNDAALTASNSGWGTSPHPPGACVPSGPASEPAISTGGAPAVTAIDAALTGPPDRTGNYTGTPPPAPAPITPSVVNAGPTATGGTGAYSGEWASPADLDNLVNTLANYADVAYPKTGNCPCAPTGGIAGTNSAPQITFVNGDFNMGSGSGAGVLIVTGTLSFTGNAGFNGLVLVIGQGNIQESGGGNGGFNGTVFVAKTHSSPFPGTELAVLGTPTYNWSGGGNSYLHYNSCWSRIGNTLSYGIIAMREEMY
jgi:hypothetical protein